MGAFLFAQQPYPTRHSYRMWHGKKSTLLNNVMKSGVYISELRYRVSGLSTFLLLQKQVVAASIKKEPLRRAVLLFQKFIKDFSIFRHLLLFDDVALP